MSTKISKNSRMLVLTATFAAVAGIGAVRAEAQSIHVGIGIPLPSISFHAAPTLVALPGSYAYAVPDYEAEIFFYDGFWWRPWEGRWYRSSYYDRGWETYGSVPVFYSGIPRDWRTRYRNHDWDGRRWEHERVNYNDVERNWSSWKRDRHWDRTVRDAGRRDDRYEKSGARPEQQIQERNAPANRSDSGPARMEQPKSSGRSSGQGDSKMRSSGGDQAPSKAKSAGGSQPPSKARSSGGNQAPSKARSAGGSQGPSKAKSAAGNNSSGKAHSPGGGQSDGRGASEKGDGGKGADKGHK